MEQRDELLMNFMQRAIDGCVLAEAIKEDYIEVISQFQDIDKETISKRINDRFLHLLEKKRAEFDKLFDAYCRFNLKDLE